MAGPGWLADTFAVIMLVVAVYAASRLVTGWLRHRTIERDVDITHVLMGVAMAGMFLPRLNPLDNRVWIVVFGVVTAWFAVRSAREFSGRPVGRAAGHCVPHAVEGGAMLYMLLPASGSGGSTGGMTSSGGMTMGGMAGMAGSSGGMGMARFPTLTLVLALFMVGYAVLLADRITAFPAVAGVGGATVRARPVLAPRAAGCNKIAMAVTMAYMLVVML